jgi:hypothetical protein
MNTPINVAHLDTGISAQHPAAKYIKSMVAIDRQGCVRSGDVHPQSEHGNYTLVFCWVMGLLAFQSCLQLYNSIVSVCQREAKSF